MEIELFYAQADRIWFFTVKGGTKDAEEILKQGKKIDSHMIQLASQSSYGAKAQLKPLFDYDVEGYNKFLESVKGYDRIFVYEGES